MTIEEEIDFWLKCLGSSVARDRAGALQALSAKPIPDSRLLESSERLLEDRTMALLSLPFSFGEVRWDAAAAVAALRRVLGISEPVVIEDVFAPCSTDQAVALAKSAGIPTSPGGIDGILSTLETLAAMDRLPRRRIKRTP